MKTYSIFTPYGTKYVIDSDGCFLEYNNNKWAHPHGTWKCTGCAKLLPFGNFRFIPLVEFLEMIESGENFKYKNGKPKYTLTDLDHGTKRIHGNTIYHGISRAHINETVEE